MNKRKMIISRKGKTKENSFKINIIKQEDIENTPKDMIENKIWNFLEFSQF